MKTLRSVILNNAQVQPIVKELIEGDTVLVVFVDTFFVFFDTFSNLFFHFEQPKKTN